MTSLASYPWLAVSDIRVVKDGEWYWSFAAYPGPRQHWATAGFSPIATILVPCNVYGVYRLEDIKIRGGHEPDGNTLAEAWRPLMGSRGLYAVPEPDGSTCEDLFPAPDSFRLFVRKIKPKTRRVLVVEYYDPSPTLEQVVTASAAADGRLYKISRHFIEERPL